MIQLHPPLYIFPRNGFVIFYIFVCKTQTQNLRILHIVVLPHFSLALIYFWSCHHSPSTLNIGGSDSFLIFFSMFPQQMPNPHLCNLSPLYTSNPSFYATKKGIVGLQSICWMLHMLLLYSDCSLGITISSPAETLIFETVKSDPKCLNLEWW